jgi:hypothetical protein
MKSQLCASLLAVGLLTAAGVSQESPETIAFKPTPLLLGPQKTMLLEFVGVPDTTSWATAVIVEDTPPKLQLMRKEPGGMGRLADVSSDRLQVDSGEARVVSFPSGGTFIAFLSLPPGADLRVVVNEREAFRFLTRESVLLRGTEVVEKPGYKLNNFVKEFLVDFKELPLHKEEVVRLSSGEFMTGNKGLKAHGTHMPIPLGKAAAVDKAALPYLSLRIRIDGNGKVASYQPTHGIPTPEMVTKMKEWRFKPFVFENKAVPVIGVISFHLDGNGNITRSSLEETP